MLNRNVNDKNECFDLRPLHRESKIIFYFLSPFMIGSSAVLEVYLMIVVQSV